MSIRDIFVRRATHLYWERLPADHAEWPGVDAPIEPDTAYVVVRLSEMYLRDARVLWRKTYPMLHASVTHAGSESHTVAGPAQLRTFGDTNLDRAVTLNYVLAGPTPMRGGDLTVMVGLYAVPGEDTAAAFISVATVSGLALGTIPALVTAVRTGVERVIGLDTVALQLGVLDTFSPGKPLRSGFLVGIAADASTVRSDRLWIDKGGHLIAGNDPPTAKRYVDHDYLVIDIERREARDDWASLPEIDRYNTQFRTIMADTVASVEQKRSKLNELWPHFTQALHDHPALVRPDAQGIARRVGDDLTDRLKALASGDRFELRSVGRAPELAPPGAFDFIYVPSSRDAGPLPDGARPLSAAPF